MDWRRRAPSVAQVVVVTTVSEGSLRGLLVERGGGWLRLTATEVAGQDTNGNLQWTPLQGEVLVPLEQVHFVQSGLDAAILGRVRL